MPYFDQAGDRTTKKQMTDTALATLQANVADYAQEQSWTKQQTIAFTILAIFEQGYGIGRAVEMVCGPNAMEVLSGTDWTAPALYAAVRDSFFS
jgi:hypothetical protein